MGADPMTIKSGVGARIYVDEFAVGQSVYHVPAITAGASLLDTTVVADEGMRRGHGKVGGSMSLMAAFDDAAGASFDAFSRLPSADVVATYAAGSTAGARTFSVISKQMSFGATVDVSGALMLPVELVSNDYGLCDGVMLTDDTHTSTGVENLTGVDELGAAGSTDHGASAFLHVIGFTGTSATIAVQDSADDVSYADIDLDFTVSAVGGQRVATTVATENVRRYIRARIAGTFTSMEFALTFMRHGADTVA